MFIRKVTVMRVINTELAIITFEHRDSVGSHHIELRTFCCDTKWRLQLAVNKTRSTELQQVFTTDLLFHHPVGIIELKLTAFAT